MTIRKLDRKATTLSVASFYELEQLGKFNYDPPYQRKSIWSEEKQSFFIDSILRNFPIPAVFLHRKIDPNTGATSYDVIDGKQRLSAIKGFILNQIPASNEHGLQGESGLIDGVLFKEMNDTPELLEVRAAFWKYELPVEYIDPTDVEAIEDVFDRLNRNGEPLNGQELRNAKYHSTSLAIAVEELSRNPFLTERLKVTDKARMEDKEFCAECLFSTLKMDIIGSSRKILDDLYEKHSREDMSMPSAVAAALCAQLGSITIDYEGYRISGVSHLYGLWGLALVLHNAADSVVNHEAELVGFFASLRGATPGGIHDEYRKSMASRTKERNMRVKRLNALLAACNRLELALQ
jgi:hypothetical protein